MKSPIAIICRKELRDTIRDRNTLLSMVVMPLVLMPLLFIGMGRYTQWQAKQAEAKTVTVGVFAAEPLPTLVEALKNTPQVNVQELTGDPKTAITDKKVDAALVVPSGTNAKIAAAEPVSLPLLSKSTANSAGTAMTRVAQTVTAYSSTITGQRLLAAKVNPGILSPVTVAPEDISSKQEVAGLVLGYILPMFIVIWSIAGGQYTAIDVSAGEKERKTLEALLLTPARRIDVVAGKFLAVSIVSATSVVLAIGSMYFSMRYAGLGNAMSGTNLTAAANASTQLMDFKVSVEPAALALMLLVGLLTVSVFSSVMLSIAIFANSFKEAQSYIGPAYMVVVLPIVLLNSLGNTVTPTWLFAIPAANGVALFKEVLMGTYNNTHIGLTIASLVVFSIIALLIATKIYEREKILITD